MLFEEAVSLYWADKSRRLRGNTLEGYASAIRRHLMPAWAGRELESITHDEVQSWVDSIPTYGAAEKAYKTFRQVYRWTVRKRQLLGCKSSGEWLYMGVDASGTVFIDTMYATGTTTWGSFSGTLSYPVP